VTKNQIDQNNHAQQTILAGSCPPAFLRKQEGGQGKNQPSNANILIVDDDPQAARLLLETLARKAINASLVNDKKAALNFFEKNNCDLAFISQKIQPEYGSQCQTDDVFDLVKKIKANSPELPIIMMANIEGPKVQNEQPSDYTNHTLLRLGTQAAVMAVRAGCCNFLIKPLEREKVEAMLDTFLPNHAISTAASAHEGTRCLYQIVGKSPKLIQTVNLASKIAPTSLPVLISGENGTGKELISSLIHHRSKRSTGPYIKVNCAALSDTLLESELFGHEKGAYTGAYTQRKGRFEAAHGGTLLLDEITETPPKFQAKLLRIIEQQEFERVGGNENIKVDVRIISTTNKNLLDEVRNGRFRQDLYYRLSTARLVLCPLRNRREDMPELVWHFVNLHARQTQRRITKIDSVMMDIFSKYHWPGNVRQLRNVVLTSLILGVGNTLSLADVSWLFDELQPLPQQDQSQPDEPHICGLGSVPLEQLERRAILETLQQTDGNRTKAAKALGISDRTLRDKIRRYQQQNVIQPA